MLICVDDPVFTIHDITNSFCVSVGRPKQEYINKGFLESNALVEQTEAIQMIIASFRKVTETTKTERMDVIRYDVGNKKRLWNIINYSVFMDGGVVYILSTWIDITDFLTLIK